MATITGLVKKFKELDIDTIIVDGFEDTKDGLANINRERMLDGVKSDGSKMPHYSYISQKVYGYPDEPIKLKDTGEFQSGITIDFTKDLIKTTSKDFKTEKLVKRFSGDIFGTGGDYHNQYVREYLSPALKKKITNFTGLKFE